MAASVKLKGSKTAKKTITNSTVLGLFVSYTLMSSLIETNLYSSSNFFFPTSDLTFVTIRNYLYPPFMIALAFAVIFLCKYYRG